LRSLLIATALIETAAGLALVVAPEVAGWLLLDASLDAAASVVARVAGAALIALGSACWIARNDTAGRAAVGLLVGMLFYNLAVLALLLYAALGLGHTGYALWPGVVLHTGMAAWCSAVAARR
jgi:hypothetical protein